MIELDPPESGARPRPRPRSRRRIGSRRRRQAYGAVGLCAVAGLIALVIMAYGQVFTPGVPATVISARAGLLMSTGADVTIDGVTVGRVTSITPAGDQARLGISLTPGEARRIPANVRASIQAPTVFGPKYLSLVMPDRPSAQKVRADEIIEPTQEPTEMDTAFASLISVLNSVHPAKLAATLGAISTALRGNGAAIGNFVAQTDTYLRQLNPSLPALSADLHTAPRVLSTFSAAAPDLIKSLDNLRPASGTLVSQQAQFDAFLLNLTGLANTTDGFLSANEKGLTGTLATLLPTGNLLAQYSPEFPCLFASINQEGQSNASAKALAMDATFLPGVKPYTPSRNLPVIGATGRPSCYGGPIDKAQAAHWPLIRFNDGTRNFFSGNENLTPGSPPLAVRLFGRQGAGAAASAARNGRNH